MPNGKDSKISAKSTPKWRNGLGHPCREPSPKIMWEYGNGARFRTLRSTIVENPLQIGPFYAKQTQFPRCQMYVSIFSQMAYEYKHNWTLSKNKPKQTQFARE